MLALILLIVCLLGVIILFEYKTYELTNSFGLTAFDIECRLDFVLLTVVEAILMQGPSPHMFRCVSSRMVVLILSLVALVLMQFYSGYLVSSLLSEPKHTITDLNSLYRSDLQIGMENASFNFHLLGNATQPMLRKIYEKRILANPSSNILSLNECAKRIKQGGFAGYVQIPPTILKLKGVKMEN